MAKGFADIAFTPRVQALQTRYGSRRAYARRSEGARETLGPDEREFIESRDSFYLGTVGETRLAVHPAPRRPKRLSAHA